MFLGVLRTTAIIRVLETQRPALQLLAAMKLTRQMETKNRALRRHLISTQRYDSAENTFFTICIICVFFIDFLLG